MKSALLLITASLGCLSCSTNVATTANGDRLVSNQLLSKGGLIKQGDTIVMFGDAEKATEQLANYGGLLVKAALIGKGVDALKNVSNNVVEAVKD